MEKYLINPNHKVAKINKDIYGHFSEHLGRCVYEGLFVGKDSSIPNVNGMRCDVVQALKEMGIPVLRWPGGCFADEYHWKDGVGPQKDRKKIINTNWGGVVEDNSFGTHEFLELCAQLGCDAYINGNVGSGSVREMSEWVEYMTFAGQSPMSDLRRQNGREEPWNIRYFGVGNESWGCGGHMSPEYYGNTYKKYNTYVRDYDPNDHIYRIACGPNSHDFDWTDILVKTIGTSQTDGISLHYYTVPHNWDKKGSALDFTKEEYYLTLAKAYRMDELIRRHTEIMNRHDPQKKLDLIVDEWGTWYDVEPGTNPGFLYQQNTMRDAIVAGLNLNIFNKHADRVKMANIAQLVNVLQAVILTDGEKMLLTPTYHVFKMFKDHQNNTLLGSYITGSESVYDGYVLPNVTESASIDENGVICSTLVNTSDIEPVEVLCQIADTAVSDIKAEILTNDPHAYNDFYSKDTVRTDAFTDFTKTSDGFKAVLPPCSIVKFTVK